MRKFLKIAGITLAILLLAALLTYIWVVRNAESLIREFVRYESGGKISLRSDNVRYSFRNHRFELINPRIQSTNQDSVSTAYRIRAKKILLTTGSVYSFIANRKITIDSIISISPEVEVIKEEKNSTGKKISIPDEMSKVYRSIEEVIEKLNLRHFSVQSGSFIILKKYAPEETPVSMSMIDMVINVPESEESSEKKPDFANHIFFVSRNQDIVFPDGYHGLRYRKLTMNTEQNLMVIDSCFVYGNKTANQYGSFGVFFDSLKLTNTDLQILAKENVLKVDSALCINPNIRFDFEIKETPGSKPFPLKARVRDSLEQSFKNLLGNLDVKYIGVSNAGIDLSIKRGRAVTTYTSDKSNFNIQDLLINEDPDKPIQIGRFDIAIRNYVGYSADSAYAIRFDSILLVRNKVSLSNFSIGPTPGNQQPGWREMTMRAFELENITWPQLIYNNKIVAEKATLVQPEVEIVNRGGNIRKRAKGSLYQALGGFKRNLEINQLFLRDADVKIQSADGTLLNLQNFNTGLLANDLLKSSDAGDLINSIHQFSFSTGYLSNSAQQFNLYDGMYNGKEHLLKLGRASYSNREKNHSFAAGDIEITDVQRTGSFQFRAGTVSWKKANIEVNQQEKKPTKAQTLFHASWDETRGSDTRVIFNNAEISLNTHITELSTRQVSVTEGQIPEIKDLKVSGNLLQFNSRSYGVSLTGYQFADGQSSELRNIDLRINAGKRQLNMQLPTLNLRTDLTNAMNGKTAFDEIILNNPVISLEDRVFYGEDPVNNRIRLPVLRIKRLELNRPVFTHLPSTLANTNDSIKVEPGNIWLENIRSDGKLLNIGTAGISLQSLQLGNENYFIQTGANSPVNMLLSGLDIFPDKDNEKLNWKLEINHVSTPYLDAGFRSAGQITNRITVKGLTLSNLLAGKNYRYSISDFLIRNPDLKIQTDLLEMVNEKSAYKIKAFRFDNGMEYLEADSFSLRPVPDRESFMSAQIYRKDYVTIQSAGIKVRGISGRRYQNDSLLIARFADIRSPEIHIYKDMRLPFRHGVIKPLPTDLLKKIKTNLKLDSIRLGKGLVKYEEYGENGKTGIVTFNDLDALITDFSNNEPKTTDSLRIQAIARFMDTAMLRLRYHESYADSLNGFIMGLHIGPFGLSSLNEMLEPLVSARIDNGYLDTLIMQATGREYLAWGTMKMYYKGLHVQFLNKADAGKRTFLTRMGNFIANSFLLRKKNVKKTGTLYFERVRERSFFHYWMKIVLSGALNNAGLRSNKKEIRRNHKAVRKLYVPEVPVADIGVKE